MSTAAQLVAGLAAGLALGALHFATLWWNTRLVTGAGPLRVTLVQVLRLLLLAAVLTGLARLGAAALLAGAAGLLAVRHVALRLARRGTAGG